MPQACSREQLWAKSSALIFRAYILAMLNKLYIYIYVMWLYFGCIPRMGYKPHWAK